LKLILPIAISVAFLAGFAIAWLAKPVTAQVAAESIPAPRMRVERPAHDTHRPTSAKPAEFFQRMQEAGSNKSKLNAVLAAVTPAEIPGLLADFQARAGVSGLRGEEMIQFQELVKTWYTTTPAAALAWLHGLPKPRDREQLLEQIAVGLAETDLDGALALLRQERSSEQVGVSIPSELIEKAVTQGEAKLVEVCRLGLGLGRGGDKGTHLIFPGDFDFKRVFDGLAEGLAAFGKDGGYDNLPTNLIGEWTKRDPQAAWEWLQQGKAYKVPAKFEGRFDEFFESYAQTAPPEEAGLFLGTVFASDKDFNNPMCALTAQPSLELLDAFLQAAPGERSERLQRLFKWSIGWRRGWDHGKVRFLLLERMTPEQRLEALRSYREPSTKQEQELIPVLRRLGHSEEEIRTLLPPRE
jgi:hypothetical protein